MDKDFSFSSERLMFRGIKEEDAIDIVKWRSNPENYKNFLNAKPITLDEHLKWFKGYLVDESRYDFMILESDGTKIGTCALSSISANSCEISYMIGEESCRGKGYAKEAVRALTRIAFDELGVQEVIARILTHNEASMHVVLGSGYSEYERIYRIENHD